MARGVGELVVTLALNAGNYTAGLTKAEKDTKAFAGRVNTAILQVGKAFAAFEIAAVFIQNTKEIISQAAALNDLSDITGSSVESLSKLSNQAAIAGTDMATLQGALQKLAVGMSDASEEGSKTQQALKLLGITTRDPVEAMQEAGQKLGNFKDGVNKVGLAAALFGAKAGPAFLASLKDISELGSVVATVTKRQAEEAEALEKSYRSLGVQATKFRNIILSDVVPALNEMIARFLLARETGSGIFGAIFKGIDTQLDAGDRLVKVTKEVAQVQATIDKQKTSTSPFVNTFRDSREANERELAELKQKQKFLSLVVGLQQKNNDALRSSEDRGFDPSKTEAPKLPDIDKGAAGKAFKRDLEDRLRALDNSVKDEQETFRDREQFLRAYYQDDLIGLRDFFSGRNAALDESFTKQAAALAKEEAILRKAAGLDEQGNKARNPAGAAPTADLRAEAEQKLIEVIAKTARLQQDTSASAAMLYLEESRAVQNLRDSIEQTGIALAEMRGDSVTAATASFDFANRKIQAQLGALATSANPEDQRLGAIGQQQQADQRALIILRAQLTKATDDYRLTLDELGLSQERIDLAQARGDITTLDGLRQKSDLAARYSAILRGELQVAEKLAEATGRREDVIRVQQLRLEMERLAATGDLVAKQFDAVFSSAFETALNDAVSGTKSLKDAFNDMVKSIVAGINRIAAQNIAEALFGGKGTSGSGSMLAQFFSLLFGGASSGGGISNISGGNYGGGLAYAAGGGYFPRGGMTVVGEQGPELLNLPAGARVHSNSDSARMMGGKSVQIIQNITVQPGANTQSAMQIAKRLHAVTASAARDR